MPVQPQHPPSSLSSHLPSPSAHAYYQGPYFITMLLVHKSSQKENMRNPLAAIVFIRSDGRGERDEE